MLVLKIIALIISVVLLAVVGICSVETMKSIGDATKEERPEMLKQGGQAFMLMGIMLLVWSVFLSALL